MKKLITRTGITVVGLLCAWPLAGFSQTANSASDDASAVKTNYHFKQKMTPARVVSSGCGIFFVEGDGVYSCTGTPLSKFSNQITDIAFSPASTSYALVGMDKKEPRAAVFSMGNNEDAMIKFKNKKMGQPSSVAYSPDARTLYLACGDKAQCARLAHLCAERYAEPALRA